jgi:hypothetical protein
VLAPLFADIESEGYSTKVGFTQPRADLVIPSLKLIIEAKFARATDSLKEIQKQLAQDAAMYFPQGGQYDRMIAFVWDEAARTEEHATLIQGLEKLDRVAGDHDGIHQDQQGTVVACTEPRGSGGTAAARAEALAHDEQFVRRQTPAPPADRTGRCPCHSD